MRIKDWRIAFLFLLLCALTECLWAASIQAPIVPHTDPADEREFQNVYQAVNAKPSIYISAGAPTFAPARVGDIDIATTTSKVYIATAAVTSGSWAIVN